MITAYLPSTVLNVQGTRDVQIRFGICVELAACKRNLHIDIGVVISVGFLVWGSSKVNWCISGSIYQIESSEMSEKSEESADICCHLLRTS